MQLIIFEYQHLILLNLPAGCIRMYSSFPRRSLEEVVGAIEDVFWDILRGHDLLWNI